MKTITKIGYYTHLVVDYESNQIRLVYKLIDYNFESWLDFYLTAITLMTRNKIHKLIQKANIPKDCEIWNFFVDIVE